MRCRLHAVTPPAIPKDSNRYAINSTFFEFFSFPFFGGKTIGLRRADLSIFMPPLIESAARVALQRDFTVLSGENGRATMPSGSKLFPRNGAVCRVCVIFSLLSFSCRSESKPKCNVHSCQAVLTALTPPCIWRASALPHLCLASSFRLLRSPLLSLLVLECVCDCIWLPKVDAVASAALRFGVRIAYCLKLSNTLYASRLGAQSNRLGSAHGAVRSHTVEAAATVSSCGAEWLHCLPPFCY